MTTKDMNKQFVFVALAAALTLLPFLGLTDFHTKGEPREAIVAYTMLDTGNWILPVNNGGDLAYKPPFFHWCIATVSALAGRVSEYTSRLPSALALIAMLLGGFLFYAKREKPTEAFLAFFITLTSFEVHRAGVNCRVDMMLTAFIVLALYRLYAWCEKKCHGVPWTAILFMGCAALTKGPVGILLPCLVTAVFLWMRRVPFLRTCLLVGAVALASCVLPALWYVAAYLQGGDSFVALVMEENLGRFLGKMTYESHENPAYYNVITLLTGYMPYTLLCLPLLTLVKFKKPAFASPRCWWQRLKETIGRMDDVRLFSLLSIVLIFVFYCIPKSKRSVYLLPIYPFIAYFLAEYLIRLVHSKPSILRFYTTFLSVVALLLPLVFGVVKAGLVPDTLFRGKHAAENLLYLHALQDSPVGILQGLLIGLSVLVAAYYLFRVSGNARRHAAVLPCALALAASLFMSMDGIYQPPVLNAKSDKGMAADIRQLVPEGPIYSYVSMDMLRFYVVNFYNDDRVALFEQELPAEGYLLVGERDFKEFEPRHAAHYTFREVYRSRKRGCDVRDIIYLYAFQKKEP